MAAPELGLVKVVGIGISMPPDHLSIPSIIIIIIDVSIIK